MKKTYMILTAIALIATLAGCGGSGESSSESEVVEQESQLVLEDEEPSEVEAGRFSDLSTIAYSDLEGYSKNEAEDIISFDRMDGEVSRTIAISPVVDAQQAEMIKDALQNDSFEQLEEVFKGALEDVEIESKQLGDNQAIIFAGVVNVANEQKVEIISITALVAVEDEYFIVQGMGDPQVLEELMQDMETLVASIQLVQNSDQEQGSQQSSEESAESSEESSEEESEEEGESSQGATEESGEDSAQQGEESGESQESSEMELG